MWMAVQTRCKCRIFNEAYIEVCDVGNFEFDKDVGADVGPDVGPAVGSVVGTSVGSIVGVCVGSNVGDGNRSKPVLCPSRMLGARNLITFNSAGGDAKNR